MTRKWFYGGTGSPRREFLYVDDLADACLFLMKQYNEAGLVNIGIGDDLTIKDLAELVKKTTEYQGNIVWDAAKPDGTPRKLMDVGKLKQLGWEAKITLANGITKVYEQVKDFDWKS
jgi:GDP-L-fucose synthase